MSPPRRWPLHPHPGPDEALSSWLARLAGLYGLPVRDLLRHNLGQASALPDDPAAADLDWDPPAAVLAALAERTGAGLGELRRMTMAGWVPWLLDTLADGGRKRSTPTSASTRCCYPRAKPDAARPRVAALAT